jgi:hypothetical protein
MARLRPVELQVSLKFAPVATAKRSTKSYTEVALLYHIFATYNTAFGKFAVVQSAR